MEQLDNGKLLFYAVASNEPVGRPLAECRRVPVFLQMVHPEDSTIARESLAELRACRILRLSSEAVEQGGVLTLEELAILLTSSLSTMVRDVRKLKKDGAIIPTRGQNKDIGSSLEQRVHLIKMYLSGKSPEEIAEKIKRPLEDVLRPIQKYQNVKKLLDNRMSVEKIVQLEKISPKLVEAFRLINEDKSF